MATPSDFQPYPRRPACGSLWTVRQAAAYLNVSAPWVRNLIRLGRLNAHRPGGLGYYRLEAREVQRYATAR
jgi:excisionase family DNA binding protein